MKAEILKKLISYLPDNAKLLIYDNEGRLLDDSAELKVYIDIENENALYGIVKMHMPPYFSVDDSCYIPAFKPKLYLISN